MLRRSLPIMFLLAFVLLLVVPLVAHAQDSTPESTPVVVVTPAPTPAPILTPDNAISMVELIRGIIIAILSGGTLAVILNRFGTNKLNQDVTEKLYQSQSPASQERERMIFEHVRDINLRLLDFIDKVTDGQPNAETEDVTAGHPMAWQRNQLTPEMVARIQFGAGPSSEPTANPPDASVG